MSHVTLLTSLVIVSDKQARLVRFYRKFGTVSSPIFKSYAKRAEMVLTKDMKTGNVYNMMTPIPDWAKMVPKE